MLFIAEAFSWVLVAACENEVDILDQHVSEYIHKFLENSEQIFEIKKRFFLRKKRLFFVRRNVFFLLASEM